MLLDAPDIRSEADAHRALETLLLRQLLQTSGAFRGGAAGKLHGDLFVDALAEALADAGGIGLASELAEGPQAGRPQQDVGLALVAGGGRLTSDFGPRADPFHGGAAHHRGLDLAAAPGTPILAAEGGVVRSAGARGGYGMAVEVDHGGGLTTLYAHASELLVAPGERVERGQPIAKVGATGRATGAHLHFEVRRADRPVDPRRALNAYGIRADNPVSRGEK